MGTLTTKALGPLTTTFTPADKCSTLFLLTGLDRAGYWGYTCSIATELGDHPVGRAAAGCYPEAWISDHYESSGLGIIQPFYSPGSICPEGWATACSIVHREGVPPPPTKESSYTENSLWSNLKEGQTAIDCCPKGYSCAPKDFSRCISQGKVGDRVTGYYPVASCEPATRTLTIEADEPFSAHRIHLIRDDDGGPPRETGSGSGSGSSDNGGAEPESSNTGSFGRPRLRLQTRQIIALGICIPLAAIIIGLGLFSFLKKRRRLRQRDHDVPSHPDGPVPKPELEGSHGTAASPGIVTEKPELESQSPQTCVTEVGTSPLELRGNDSFPSAELNPDTFVTRIHELPGYSYGPHELAPGTTRGASVRQGPQLDGAIGAAGSC